MDHKQATDCIDMTLFRQRLRDRLAHNSLTHKQLAKQAGISESMIDKWLNGKKDNISGEIKDYIPSLNSVYKIANVLGVPIEYFVNPDIDFLKNMRNYTGLSDNAIECLHGWHTDQLQVGMFSSYYKDIDTLNTILEYYDKQRKKNKRKGTTLNNIYTLFHYIGSFLHASKFQRVQQDMIRYGSGTHFDTIEKGDTITKKSTGKSEKIDMLCTPISSSSHRGDDITKVDIVNTEDTSEQYYLDISDLYREHAKSQIIDTLKMIGGIE